jgi:hypothetical protein
MLAIFSYFNSAQIMFASGSGTITLHSTPHMSGGGKSESGSTYASPSFNNIAPSSNLNWNNPGLVDGNRNCACYNTGTFGRGWNPGEKIMVTFDDYMNIYSIALHLGCSQQHGEVASGTVRYVDQYGNLIHFGEFYNVGYIRNNVHLHFDPSIVTKYLEIEMSSGGGSDRNICFSELEIYGH